MRKVDLFIVGAPKAGTTSLHYYLSQHPDVSMSTMKEPNFFSKKEVEELYYGSPSVQEENAYISLFDQDKKVIGEASVSYLFYKEVPQRIHDYNPDAKLIIILRNPTERAYSHYLMDVGLGLCNVGLKEIFEFPEKHTIYYQQFVQLGLYVEQIKRYQVFFSKEQIKVLFYDDLKQDEKSFMEEVLDFLSLPPFNFNLEVKNKFRRPSNRVTFLLYQQRWFRLAVRMFFSEKTLKNIKNILFKNASKPEMEGDLRMALNSFYEKELIALEKLLQRKLFLWRGK